MKMAVSLTIAGVQPAVARLPGAVLRGAAALLLLGMTACAVEVGPPPESDPPLVPKSAKAPPAPQQPSEPQPWSRDLDFDAGPTRIDHDEVAEGLVASSGENRYSSERLTYESALDSERPPTEAELTLQRARERAAAAGTPAPPAVAPPPLAEVSAQSLPPVGEAPAPPAAAETAPAETTSAPRREPRLPPPPKFPPLPTETAAAEPSAEAADEAVPQQVAALPAPEPTSVAPVAMELAAPMPPEEAAAVFAAEAWDAPAGTILVQISAVQQQDKVVGEWQRLQARHPQVLEPLRLVVEEAKLGDRGVFYRVQAGAFGSEAGATAVCDTLIGAGQSCFVVVR